MLSCDDDRPVARLSAWALATSDTAAVTSDRHAPLASVPPLPLPDWFAQASGYAESVTWRVQPDAPDGSAIAWLSPQVSLVDDEPTTALQRLAMVVDSANGVGAALDVDEYLFIGRPGTRPDRAATEQPPPGVSPERQTATSARSVVTCAIFARPPRLVSTLCARTSSTCAGTSSTCASTSTAGSMRALDAAAADRPPTAHDHHGQEKDPPGRRSDPSYSSGVSSSTS